MTAAQLETARATAPGTSLRSQARYVGILVAVGLLLAGSIAGATFLLIRSLYDKEVRNTEQSLSSLATVLSDQADRAFQALDLVQQAVCDEIRLAGVTDEDAYVARMANYDEHEALKARVTALPQLNAVTVIDAQGKLLNFSRYWPIPNINVADRDYFRVLSKDRDRQVFVSEPVRNRGDGTWTIYNARKIVSANGTFLGLVLGAVELNYFERLYQKIAPEPDYAVSLFQDGGMLLARYPPLGNSIGQRFSPTLLVNGDKAKERAVIRKSIGLDGKERVVAARALEHYPMGLQISRTTQAALAPWRTQAAILGFAGLLLDLGLLGLVVLGVLQMRSQGRLSEAARREAEERGRGEDKLRAQSARYGTALDNMTQGLCMFDSVERLIVMNERFAAMYALPLTLRMPGTPLANIVAGMAIKVGAAATRAFPFSAQPARAQICAVSGSLLIDLADNCSTSVAYTHLPDGGWVCTHEDITDRKKSEARIAYLAHHDALTGLPNRERLREHMERVCVNIGNGATAAVLCVDLDRFKQINDTLGHPVGDHVLRQVARRLQDQTRKSDLTVRLGGDEFAVIMADVQQADEVALLADRIIRAVSSPFEVGEHRIEIGASVGIFFANVAETPADEMLRSADIALYYAKAAGRGTWRYFEPEMDVQIKSRRALTNELKQALAQEQFEVVYQPLVNAITEQVIGYEALLRWRHPSKGLVSPADFIPLAEESGLIRPIGSWILHRVCAEAATWPLQLKAAVNLSPIQFLGGGLVQDVRLALAHSGLDPNRLELEVTESVLLQDDESTLAQLHQLRHLGVRICMDDFGTGYSSLNYLRRFPFNKIKVDRSFVRNIMTEQGSVDILRAIVALGKALGMSVLAEGIETQLQRDVLRAEGYDELQGYFFGRPEPSSCLSLKCESTNCE